MKIFFCHFLQNLKREQAEKDLWNEASGGCVLTKLEKQVMERERVNERLVQHLQLGRELTEAIAKLGFISRKVGV